MEKQILISISEAELQNHIRMAVRDVVSQMPMASPRPGHPEIMNIDQASDFTGLSKKTIYKLTSGLDIPFHKKRKRLMFKREELNDWLIGDK
jgi:excisionase family DNA binding protein